MDQPDREAEPHFTLPIRQIVLMVLVLALTGVVVMMAEKAAQWLAHEALRND